eukprot:TRINITY_DN4481_c0_g1_i1.p1 TRINITY_DN4481_c0_g1~~TRINITY_DN4481_c0_g1_i1.p1  ORF type:complete len:2551 (-),score=385.14 TRINITY_DN4481_c0_g1_i1:287-7939(-)
MGWPAAARYEPPTRVVQCNWGQNPPKKFLYAVNEVRTAKYNANPLSLNFFLWKNLFEQFYRVANLYFLFIAILQFIPGLSPTGQFTTLWTLAIVLTCSAARALYEDVKRHKADREVNHRTVLVLRNGSFVEHIWTSLQPGDVVRVLRNSWVPADVVLLGCCSEGDTSETANDGVAFVDTMDLDGETNLKPRRALRATMAFCDAAQLAQWQGTLECDAPHVPSHRQLGSFTGTLNWVVQGDSDIDGDSLPTPQTATLGPEQLLLRGSRLKCVDVYGIVAYTGGDMKIQQHQTSPPHKRSTLEITVNVHIRWIFFIQLVLCVVCSVGGALWLHREGKTHWYINMEDVHPGRAGFTDFWTFVILFNNLIPISLYVSMELVKILQGSLIESDLQMYDEERGVAAAARTTSLNEELGMVQYVLSDKTGTLTQNVMQFARFSVEGMYYGAALEAPQFDDQRIVNGKWRHEPEAERIGELLLIMMVCHSVECEVDPLTGETKYSAASPDEGCLVAAARSLGFAFKRRSTDSVVVEVEGEEMVFGILATLEFTSARRRMSIILRSEDGRIVLYSKGADTVLLPRIAKDLAGSTNEAQRALKQFGNEGLRTLVFGYCDIDDSTFEEWREQLAEVSAEAGDSREDRILALWEKVEANMSLVGVTGIRDKLQVGVPETIEALREAGIRIWMLTGDQTETAVNVAVSCSLVTYDSVLLKLTEEKGLDIALHSCVKRYCANNRRDVLALVIEGSCLRIVLESPELTEALYELLQRCTAVVCSRMSPGQKASVARLIADRKKKGGGIVLAIGDGANDVSMIQTAHIGVGISGYEGYHAANSSDYSIAQFRFLWRLLMVHGRWNYNRIAELLLYSFYKNNVLYLTQFFFCMRNGYSGQSFYDKWALANYNLLFTSIPLIVHAVCDRDIQNVDRLRQYPGLYSPGQKNEAFSKAVFLQWFVNGIFHSFLCHLIPIMAHGWDKFQTGKTYGMDVDGTMTYTCVVWIVNLKLALQVKSWTWLHHVAIWGSIAIWHIFLLVYQYITPLSWTLYAIVSPMMGWVVFWFTIAATVTLALLRDFVWKYYLYNVSEPTELRKFVQKLDARRAAVEVRSPTFESPRSGTSGSRKVQTADANANGVDAALQHQLLFTNATDTFVFNPSVNRWLRFIEPHLEAEFVEYYEQDGRRVAVTMALAAVLSAFIVVQSFVSRQGSVVVAGWCCFSFTAGIAALVFAKLGPYFARTGLLFWAVMAVVAICFTSISIAHLTSADSVTHPVTIGLVALGMLVAMRPPFYAAFQYLVLAILCFFLAFRLFPVPAWTDAGLLARFLEEMLIFIPGIVTVYLNEWFLRESFASSKGLEVEKQRVTQEENRSLALLRNTLPSDVVAKMITVRVPLSAFAHVYPCASVLLSDIVRFTEFSSLRQSEDVIRMVNKMFNKFDVATTQLCLEKIKTIGDAYMCTDLLHDKHAMKIAEMGIRMIEAVEELNQEDSLSVSIRIGVGMGCVTAGVLGYTKLAYDLFGEAIEEAKEFERTGEPMTVHCSDVFFHQLEDAFDGRINEDAFSYSITGRSEQWDFDFSMQPHGSLACDEQVAPEPDDIDPFNEETVVPKTPETKIRINDDGEDEEEEIPKEESEGEPEGEDAPPQGAANEENGKEGSDVALLATAKADAMAEAQIKNYTLWREVDPQMDLPPNSRYTLRFKNPVLEREFVASYRALAIANLKGTYLVNSIVWFLISAFMAILFRDMNSSGLFVIFYILAFVNALLWAGVTAQRSRENRRRSTTVSAAAATAAAAIKGRGLRLKTEPVITIAPRDTEQHKEATKRRNQSIEAPQRVCHFWIALVCTITGSFVLLFALIVVDDVQTGVVLPFALVGFLLCVNNYYWFLFWQKVAFGALYLLVLLITYFAKYGSKWRGADVLSLIVTFLLSFLSVRHLELPERRSFHSTKMMQIKNLELARSSARSERMLQNVLPKSIAARLRTAPDQPIVDTVDGCSIMFVHFYGLEEDADMGPIAMFKAVNRALCKFDKLCLKHKVEKIKTNPYMVVAGCPEPRSDHAQQLVTIALEFLELAKEYREETGSKLHVKMGIHSGRVCAGVVGSLRFIWDIFGDPVNVAARITSAADWGQIRVSRHTKDLTEDAFVWQDEVELPLKGKGMTSMFTLATEDMVDCSVLPPKKTEEPVTREAPRPVPAFIPPINQSFRFGADMRVDESPRSKASSAAPNSGRGPGVARVVAVSKKDSKPSTPLNRTRPLHTEPVHLRSVSANSLTDMLEDHGEAPNRVVAQKAPEAVDGEVSDSDGGEGAAASSGTTSSGVQTPHTPLPHSASFSQPRRLQSLAVIPDLAGEHSGVTGTVSSYPTVNSPSTLTPKPSFASSPAAQPAPPPTPAAIAADTVVPRHTTREAVILGGTTHLQSRDSLVMAALRNAASRPSSGKTRDTREAGEMQDAHPLPVDPRKQTGVFVKTYNFGLNKYHGEWLEGRRHGYGVMTHVDGSKYMGHWRDDMMHGPGTYYYPSGGCTQGEWVNNELEGQAIYTNNKAEKFSTWYKDGVCVSQGLLSDTLPMNEPCKI